MFADKHRRLSLDKLKAILIYDPQTGDFISKIRRGRRGVGTIAGTPRKDGYFNIQINGHLYLAHRLAWFYHYGKWPQDRIDHIKGKRNNIDNLREASQQQNTYNTNGYKKKSLSKGIFKCRDGAYETCIRYKGRGVYLGRSWILQDVVDLYNAASFIIHANFRPKHLPTPNGELLTKVTQILNNKSSKTYKKWERTKPVVFRKPE